MVFQAENEFPVFKAQKRRIFRSVELADPQWCTTPIIHRLRKASKLVKSPIQCTSGWKRMSIYLTYHEICHRLNMGWPR